MGDKKYNDIVSNDHCRDKAASQIVFGGFCPLVNAVFEGPPYNDNDYDSDKNYNKTMIIYI